MTNFYLAAADRVTEREALTHSSFAMTLDKRISFVLAKLKEQAIIFHVGQLLELRTKYLALDQEAAAKFNLVLKRDHGTHLRQKRGVSHKTEIASADYTKKFREHLDAFMNEVAQLYPALKLE